MGWPFVSRRLKQELANVKADRERIRGERNQFAEDRDAFKYAAETASEKYTDVCIVNDCLTEDLTEVRAKLAASMDAESALARQIHEMAQPVEHDDGRTVADVLAEYDAHRKAIADALHTGNHLNWKQLIKAARDTYEGALDWKADYETEKKRADRLESGLPTASREDVEAWEKRVKSHDAWTPPADLEKRPVDGGSGRPTHPATELLRAQDRCRELEARLAKAEHRGPKWVAS